MHDIIAFAFDFIISALTIICGRQQIQLVTTESEYLQAFLFGKLHISFRGLFDLQFRRENKILETNSML